MRTTTLTRRSLLGTALTLPAWDPALAQSPGGTLRVGMTLAAIPLSNGCPDQGGESQRFMGITLYNFLVEWDLSRGDRPTPLKPVVGRPFDDAKVLRIGHAYEQATPWRDRRPSLIPGATPPPLPPVPDPTLAEIGPAGRDQIAVITRCAGLRLNERQFELPCAAAPFVEQMAGRLRRPLAFTEEPASIFRFGAT